LHRRADGRIYSSPELRDWFAQALPDDRECPTIAIDGDLPKREWFEAEFSRPLSDMDGEVHTVLPGRPMGMSPEFIGQLAGEQVHFHFYGEIFQKVWGAWLSQASALAPGHLHLHPQTDQASWVSEFSKYDAGWLHTFSSCNGGDLRRANWDDLNYPSRMATLAGAGVPLIQRDNSGSVVATQSLARRLDNGVFFTDCSDLAAQLRDHARMKTLRANAQRQRALFTFDHYADGLIDFFRDVIAARV
jgi:hypothetical protein